MLIDPGSKGFIVIFTLVVVGVLGFFIASIFIDTSKDEELDLSFKNSDFSITVTRLDDSTSVLNLYRGEIPSSQNDN